MTKGEKMVRTDFNASGKSEIDEIKNAAARLIDLIEKYRDQDPRLVALAQTAFEEGAMWAVKAATAK